MFLEVEIGFVCRFSENFVDFFLSDEILDMKLRSVDLDGLKFNFWTLSHVNVNFLRGLSFHTPQNVQTSTTSISKSSYTWSWHWKSVWHKKKFSLRYNLSHFSHLWCVFFLLVKVHTWRTPICRIYLHIQSLSLAHTHTILKINDFFPFFPLFFIFMLYVLICVKWIKKSVDKVTDAGMKNSFVHSL